MRIEQVVGRRLREAREAQGLSQEELGRELRSYLGRAWPGQQVSVAEDGGRKFTALELFSLCMVLSRPISYFFLPAGPDPIEVPGDKERVGAELIHALMVWGGEENWNAVAPVVASIAGTMPARLLAVEDAARRARMTMENLAAVLREGVRVEEASGEPIQVVESEATPEAAAEFLMRLHETGGLQQLMEAMGAKKQEEAGR